MKKFLLNIWYTILFQFDNHRDEIPDWWYEDKPFEDQPQWMQRVAVAKDVIAQINISKYKAKSGSYVKTVRINNKLYDSDDIKNSPAQELDIKKSINDSVERCTVCALGACIISISKFKNTLKWGEVLHHSNFTSEKSTVLKMLIGVFTPYQLAMIETAFEGSYNQTCSDRVGKILGVYNLSSDDEWNCKRLYNDDYYGSDDSRLQRIMQNIIDNKGEFKP